MLQMMDIPFRYASHLKRNYVRLRKTDPYRRGCGFTLFATGQLLCPVTALNKYLELRGQVLQEEPLFCHHDGRILSRDSFIRLLHSSGLEAANIPVSGVKAFIDCSCFGRA